MFIKQSKHDLEILLSDINILLNDEKALAASDRFAGRGATKNMWLEKQAAITQQYVDMISNETKLSSQRSFIPTWQENYDLI